VSAAALHADQELATWLTGPAVHDRVRHQFGQADERVVRGRAAIQYRGQEPARFSDTRRNGRERARPRDQWSLPGIVAVRDSKDPAGPVLAFTPTDWHAFTTAIKAGEFGLA